MGSQGISGFKRPAHWARPCDLGNYSSCKVNVQPGRDGVNPRAMSWTCSGWPHHLLLCHQSWKGWSLLCGNSQSPLCGCVIVPLTALFWFAEMIHVHAVNSENISSTAVNWQTMLLQGHELQCYVVGTRKAFWEHRPLSSRSFSPIVVNLLKKTPAPRNWLRSPSKTNNLLLLPFPTFAENFTIIHPQLFELCC